MAEIPTFLVDGQDVPMPPLRSFLTRLSGQAAGALLSSVDGAAPFATLDDAQAAPAVKAGTQARVFNDPDNTKNGVYVNASGAPGGYALDQAFYGAVAQAFQPLIDRAQGATIAVATFADREAIPLAERPYGLTVYVAQGDRDFRWTQGALNGGAGWVGLYTQKEIKNLGIDFTGQLEQSKVAGLAETFAVYDDVALDVSISDFRVQALTSTSPIAVQAEWAASGAIDRFEVSWANYTATLSRDARSFRPAPWASQTRLIATGDSMLDNKWVEGAAASLGYALVNVSKYSSGSKQVYRLGVRKLYFSTTGNRIPASGAGVRVTAINGVAPSPNVSFDAFAAEGFLNTSAGDTIAVHCSEAGWLGGRHGVVSVPNAGTPTYTFTPDDGQGSTALDPQSLFVPDNLARLKTDEVIIRSTQNTFFAGPGNPVFPHDINPRVLEDIGLIVDATGGQRVTILSLTPALSFDATRRAALTYINNQFAALWPQQRAFIPGVGTNYDYIRAFGRDGSASDQDDYDAGSIPRSCMQDDQHLNAKGQGLERAFWLAWRNVQQAPPLFNLGMLLNIKAIGRNLRLGSLSEATTSAVVVGGIESDIDARVEELSEKFEGVVSNSEYFDTLAEAVAKLPVGTYFLSRDLSGQSPRGGEKRQYKRVSDAPYWIDRGPFVSAAEVGLGNVDNTNDADKPVSVAQAAAIWDAKNNPILNNASTLHLPFATMIASSFVLGSIDTICVSAYNAATKGRGLSYWVRAVRGRGTATAWRMQSADGEWWQLLAVNGINPMALGAIGRAFYDSTAGLIAAFLYQKEAVSYLLAGTPDPCAPRGGTIVSPEAQYEITDPLPIFSRLSFVSFAPLGAGGESGNVFVISSAASMFTYGGVLGPWQTRAVTFRGITFQGRENCTTNWIDDIVDSYSNAAYYWRLFDVNFTKLKRIPLYLINSTIWNISFTRMPFGNLIWGGSDNSIKNLNMNGDGYVYTATDGSTVTLTPSDGTPVALFLQFDNSHFDEAYMTGKSGTPAGSSIKRPLLMYFQTCKQVSIDRGWSDNSNGAAITISSCDYFTVKGGRFYQVGLFPPTTDFNGGVEAARYRASFTMISSNNVEIDGTLVGEVYNPTVNFLGECDNVSINVKNLNHTVALHFEGTASKSTRIRVKNWEDSNSIIPMVPDTTGGTTMTLPRIMKAQYGNSAATIDTIGVLPTAIVGREFTFVQQVASGSSIGFNVQTGDTIRGQAGKTGARVAGGVDAGATITARCVKTGQWKIVTDATPVYA